MGQPFMVRYETKPEAADENQRLVENVFAELNANNPGGLRYASFRLADGVTFVHIGVVEGDADPLAESKAFGEFSQGAGERIAGKPQRDGATLIGSYRFVNP
jgi:hypothetical protein